MEQKKTTTSYEPVHIAVIIIQALLIIVGWGSASFQLMKNIDGGVLKASAQNGTTYLLSCVAYLFIMVYAVWGYKKSIVPYRLSITTYFASLVVQTVRAVDVEKPDIAAIAVLLACIGFLIGFDNTFKKHKTAALILGTLLMLTELGMSCIKIFVYENASFGSTPFAGFILASAVLTTYASRCHWSANGKEDIFDDEEDELFGQ